MPISNSYPKGIPIEDQDLFVGTKAYNNRTVNYTAQGVADYLSINSKVAIGGQMSFQFTIVPNIPKTIAFEGGLGDNTAFSAITKLIVSAIDVSTANITIFLNYLNNSQILLSQQNQPNFFGHYKIIGYTQIGTSAFYELDLEFIGGNGTIIDKQYYDLVSFVLSTSGSTTEWGDITGDIEDQTDLINYISSQITIPTLQQVLDNNHDLVNNNNFQGTGAGDVNLGNSVNAFGNKAAFKNSGNYVNAFGDTALGGNSGNYVNALGFNAALDNSADNVNAFGTDAGIDNSFTNVNLFGFNATADTDNQNVFSKWISPIINYLGRLSFNNITADRKWELPDADGTIALTTDITTPTLQEVTDNGGNETTNEIRITDSSNILYLYQDGTIGFQNAAFGYGRLRSDLLTSYVEWQLPDAYGTIALTSDIPILTPGKNITIVSNAIAVDIPPIVNTSAILAATGDRPQGIAIDSLGNIYTANAFSDNVTKITPSGVSTILGTTGNYPFNITVDSLGNVYTCNINSNNVSKITPAGVSSILGATGSGPQGITVDSLGNVYTANSGSNNVTKITPAGVSSILATTGSLPVSIAIDSLGNIYTTNNASNNVSKITPAGVSTILGSTGIAPRGIVIDSLDNIYTANNTSNNVSKITPSGVSTILATITSGPFGITVDTSDNIYTCNTSTNNVTKITPAGVSTILGTTGLLPNGIVIDVLGNIYTNNVSSDNVTKITVDNKRILAVDDNLNIIRVNGSGGGGGGGTVTSVGLSMPSAFAITPGTSPITTSGTIAITGAGSVSQYIRGDGTLANFPNSTGGGSSVNYYLNGSVSQGTFGGDTYYQMSKTPILGGGTNFIRTNGAGNGYIASFITDAGDPSFLNIPGGNWNVEFYFQSSATGGSPQFYAELYKVSATNVFTLVASGSANPEGITNGTAIDQYFTSIPVPQTSLLITDRLAIRIYVITSGKNITLHTENGNLSEVLTTFTTGLTALNGLTAQVQNLAVGTSGTDFKISSATDTHTFNLPTASATNRGALSSTDWSAFNNKQNASTRRNANNSTNNNINYCGVALGTGVSESATVWTITRLTIAASGSITTATATNVAWTNRESVIY